MAEEVRRLVESDMAEKLERIRKVREEALKLKKA